MSIVEDKVMNPLTGRLVNKYGRTYKAALKTRLKKQNSPTEYAFENILNYNSNTSIKNKKNNGNSNSNSNNNFYIKYHNKNNKINNNSNNNSFINNDNNDNMNNEGRREFNRILKNLACGTQGLKNILNKVK